MVERDWQRDWELAKRATPGPWIVRKANGRPGVWVKGGAKIASVEAPDFPPVLEDEGRLQNATFIAEAREALPYWLQRVKKIERLLKHALHEVANMCLNDCGGCPPAVAGCVALCMPRAVRLRISQTSRAV